MSGHSPDRHLLAVALVTLHERILRHLDCAELALSIAHTKFADLRIEAVEQFADHNRRRVAGLRGLLAMLGGSRVVAIGPHNDAHGPDRCDPEVVGRLGLRVRVSRIVEVARAFIADDVDEGDIEEACEVLLDLGREIVFDRLDKDLLALLDLRMAHDLSKAEARHQQLIEYGMKLQLQAMEDLDGSGYHDDARRNAWLHKLTSHGEQIERARHQADRARDKSLSRLSGVRAAAARRRASSRSRVPRRPARSRPATCATAAAVAGSDGPAPASPLSGVAALTFSVSSGTSRPAYRRRLGPDALRHFRRAGGPHDRRRGPRSHLITEDWRSRGCSSRGPKRSSMQAAKVPLPSHIQKGAR